MVEEVEKIKEEHLKNYKDAVKEIIKTNNKALFIDDINLLLKKPPLDSMDLIKSRILSLAKKYKIIINTEILEKSLDKYRNNIRKNFIPLQKIREEFLFKKVDEFIPVKKLDIIKITKKNFNEINKKIKKKSKEIINYNIEEYILKNIRKYFSNKDISKDTERKFKEDFSKYMLKKYSKQIIENIELKILVKDTTLINGLKEQGERYLFTNNNSYLFKDSKG